MQSLMRDRMGREATAFSARRRGRRASGLGSRAVIERNWHGEQVLVRRRVRWSRSRRERRVEVAAGMTLLGFVMTGGAAASWAVALWIAS
jgi:hypothetical protein